MNVLISIIDTQEAPKSLSLDSSSSMESLASVTHTEKNLIERPRLGGAFASYVRHRGEPDGKTMEPSNVLISASRQTCQNGGGIFTIIYFNFILFQCSKGSPLILCDYIKYYIIFLILYIILILIFSR